VVNLESIPMHADDMLFEKGRTIKDSCDSSVLDNRQNQKALFGLKALERGGEFIGRVRRRNLKADFADAFGVL